jgi:hypothetical protein
MSYVRIRRNFKTFHMINVRFFVQSLKRIAFIEIIKALYCNFKYVYNTYHFKCTYFDFFKITANESNVHLYSRQEMSGSKGLSSKA